MNLKSIFISLLLVGGTFCISASTVIGLPGITTIHQNDLTLHTVAQGETVYSIAKAYGIGVEDIYKLNPSAENGIKVGEILRLPKKEARQTTSSTSYIQHRVQKGETLYSISKANSLSIETLYNHNPELKDGGLKTDMILNIPQKNPDVQKSQSPKVVSHLTKIEPATSYQEHKVQRGETLYSISRMYNVPSGDLFAMNPDLRNGLRTGMILKVPAPVQSAAVQNINQPLRDVRPLRDGETMRIGLLLPFLDNTGSVQKGKITEYYEGFLLAIQELKESGVDAEIYSFDIGTEKDTKRLKSLLETTEMSNLHLVIGGVSPQQIAILSDFSNKTGARYVIPFGSKSNSKENNANVFQMNTTHSNLYPEIIRVFANKYRHDNIIFVGDVGSGNDKSSFVSTLQDGLKTLAVSYKTIGTGENLLDEIKGAIDPNSNNLIIPTSSSELVLRKITSTLEGLGEESVSLFGYPEWQTYLHMTRQLYKYNTTIYSIFFLDENDNNAHRVMSEYKKWYNKNIVLSFPKFALLGYDTGMFFVSGLDKYREYFDGELLDMKGPTLQSAVHFSRDYDKLGYTNTGFYFVQYKKNQTVEKTEYK